VRLRDRSREPSTSSAAQVRSWAQKPAAHTPSIPPPGGAREPTLMSRVHSDSQILRAMEVKRRRAGFGTRALATVMLMIVLGAPADHGVPSPHINPNTPKQDYISNTADANCAHLLSSDDIRGTPKVIIQ
jgi:hypothetical protein